MGDTDNQHDENPVVNLVDNSVVANANAPQILPSGKFLRTWGTRISFEAL